jgi:two-component system, chemotaxis family, protein-glutamate methylesterase/glutaminase
MPRQPRVAALVASAGGLAAILRVLAELPASLPASVVVLLHLNPAYRSVLGEILGRQTALVVRQAIQGDKLRQGFVYVAPPDAHLVLAGDALSLDGGPPVQHVRPSADRLLLSLADGGARGHLGVILSGTGRDGTDGAIALREAGGTVFAQDEATSDYFGMPEAAINAGAVDKVLPIDEIAPAVIDFVAAAA